MLIIHPGYTGINKYFFSAFIAGALTMKSFSGKKHFSLPAFARLISVSRKDLFLSRKYAQRKFSPPFPLTT
jgi:hypothetical protein